MGFALHRAVLVLVHVRVQTRSLLGAGPPAAALWQRLRRSFPWTVAAALRPHGWVWLGRVPSVEHARRWTDPVVAPLRRRLGWPPCEVRAEPVSVAAAPRVASAVYAVGRAGPEDPWPGWSTARDLLGGVVDPWVCRHAYARALWSSSDSWDPGLLPPVPPRVVWEEAARAALRAPWLHASAPSVAGIVAGLAARRTGQGGGPVPRAWVDAAIRCGSQPALRGFPEPSRPPAQPPAPVVPPPAWGRAALRRDKVSA
ncbi:MAG: hypothetical protein AAGA54_36540 [Myxococcota bacterium]